MLRKRCLNALRLREGFGWLLVAAAILAGCIPASEPPRTPRPTPAQLATQDLAATQVAAGEQGSGVATDERPQSSVDLGPFRDAGCVADEAGGWTCPPDGPLAAMGCESLSDPGDLLGGLDPDLPLLECTVNPAAEGRQDPDVAAAQLEAEGYLYATGCLLPRYVRYVVARDGGFELLRNADEFAGAFAPVSSSEEALSYALAVSGYEAHYGLERRPGYRYLTDLLQDTYVADTGHGEYMVHLFSYQLCGCGPHTTSAVDLSVTADGQVTVEGKSPQFENPEEDGLCVD